MSENLISVAGRRLTSLCVHAACASPPFRAMRAEMAPLAEGRVVEVGFGSGHNVPFYDPTRIKQLVAIEPDEAMIALAEKKFQSAPFDLALYRAGGEAMPLDDQSADCVVVSYSFCTIPDVAATLGEIRRVLKPGGKLIFSEHGAATGRLHRRAQCVINGAWRRLAGGCNLTRDPVVMIKDAGFTGIEFREDAFQGFLAPLGRHVAGVALN